MIEPEFETALKFALGTEKVGHSGRTLYDHLKGTHDLLLEWGALRHVRLAGLFHSIYGTIYFKHQCLEPTTRNRELVAELIGREAERLAYIFCVIDRKDLIELELEGNPFHYIVRSARDGETLMLTPQEVIDLLWIEEANLQEQRQEQRNYKLKSPQTLNVSESGGS